MDNVKKKRSRSENVKRIIAGGLMRQMINQLLPFVTRTVIIYTMGSLYAGLNGLFRSILQVLNLAELGFGEAMVFSLYQPLAEEDTEQVCALINLYRKVCRIVGGFIGVVGVLLLPALRWLIQGEVPADVNLYVVYLLTLANTCLGYLVFAYKQAIFTADQKSDVLSLVGCGTSLVEFLLRMVMLVALRNYYLFCLVSPIVTAAGGLFINYLSKRQYPQYFCRGEVSADVLEGIKQKLLGIFVDKLNHVCRNAFDSVTLSAFMGLAVVTVFQNYFFILRAVSSITVLFCTSLVASVGNSIVLESQEKNYRDFQKFQLLFMWITGWCTVCMFCLYQPFMELWVGEKYLLSMAEMSVFCVYYFSDMMGGICFSYRQAAGLYQHRRWVPILQSAVNLTLNILFVRRFGIVGVLMSTIFCQAVIDMAWSGGILYDYYFTQYKLSRYLLRLVAYGAVTVLACAAAWMVCSLTPWTGILALIVRGGICVVVPNLVFVLALRAFPEYHDAIDFARTRLVKKRKRV